MVMHHRKDEEYNDGDEELYEQHKWNGEEKRRDDGQRTHDLDEWATHYRDYMEKKSAWSLTPQTVSTVIAVVTVLLGAVWTFSDFRVTLNDLQSRQTNMIERMNGIDAKINSIDNNGTRQLIGAESTLKSLKEQVDELREAMESVNGAIRQHNESMYDLYKRQNPGKAYPLHHDDLPAIQLPRRRSELIKPNGREGFAQSIPSPIIR